MKKVVVALVLLASFGIASAQEKTSNTSNIKFGAKGGINFANLAGDDADGAKMVVGFNAGFFVEIPVAEKLVFQPEVLYSTQGSKSKGPLFIDGSIYNVEATFKFNYINIPLLFKYEIANKFSLEAGPYVGFLTNAKLKVKIKGVGSETIDAKDLLKSTDFGLTLGMNYEFTDVIFANARYQAGLTEIGDAEGVSNNIKNSVYQIGLGFRF